MNARTRAIAKKEIKQLLRDKRMMFVILFFPVFLLAIFGYAVNFDVKHIQLAVQDLDKSDKSREFINSLTSSDYFEISKIIKTDSEIKTSLDEKDAQCVLVIPEDFSKKLYGKREEAKVQFLIDGVDGNTATIIKNYVTSATQNFNGKFQNEALAKKGIKLYNPVSLQPIFMFNPELESTKFLIPGLIAMILIITAVVSVSLSLVREKERGTIEQINVSSLSTIELLIGKALPYIIIALIDAVFILVAGYFLFDVVTSGSYLLLFISTLIFIIAATSLGVLVSVIADSQQVAFTIATFASLLPSVILSGFIFPIEGMPFIIQLLTNITPAKFYIVCLRAVILRGVGLEAFWPQLVYLILFIIFFLGLATFIRKKKNA
jgi:ABC-2 type transport system permease protein